MLLHEPGEFNDESNDGHSSKNPQLLADVMGDSAISFDGVNAEEYNNNKHLRTKIRRLPPTPASGYTSSFDIKEVLYMPPRVSPRKYEEDAGLNTTSFLNLIYIYPRLIRITGGDTNGRKLSLRIRVVEQELHEQSFDGADAVYQPSHLVYNPSCPAGPPLVESFYTKLVMAKKQPESKGRFDLPLRDEVKIRLPDVLDRRHFLQFSLLSISDGLDDTTVIADTVVPFIISSKESSSGGRVTTIIPNGLHRIQLGNEFQIHVETRLESSTHVSDAAVATLLRDHPILSLPGDSSNQLTVAPFVDMLSMASNQAIRRHFFPLVTIQILGMLNQECCMFYYESLGDMFGSDNSWHRLVPRESTDTLVASMRCLFEILDKTRTSFGEKDHSSLPIKYQQWIKLFVDSFDEKLFLLRGDIDDNVQDPFEQSIHDKVDFSFDSSPSVKGNDRSKSNSSDIPELKTNLSMISKSSVSRIRSPRKGTPRSVVYEAPFSRKAFVATKTQQMQADAELFDSSRHEYFDDDQTVMTLATTTSRMTFATISSRVVQQATKPPGSLRNINSSDSNLGFTTPPRKSNSPNASSTPFSFASKRAESMANRVNTMAQRVIAPCMAPSWTEVMPNDANISSHNPADPSSSDHTSKLVSLTIYPTIRLLKLFTLITLYLFT